jgi:CheY-like chemotaxis protein
MPIRKKRNKRTKSGTPKNLHELAMTLKLLVADDSANTQRIVGLAFCDEDAIVESVSDGERVMDAVRSFRPDVVLADSFMPGCSGYEICARIKDDPELASTAVVLLAGAFEPFDEVEASRSRCDGHLTKPFNTSDLLQTVHALAEEGWRTQQKGIETERVRMETQDNETGESVEGGAAGSNSFRLRNLVSPDVRDSFLGSNRILDLFDSDQLSAAKTAMIASVQKSEIQALQNAPSAGSPATLDVMFSENTLNSIVDTVIRRISAEAIREVAWEVVPELSESIIRRTMQEQNKS